MDVRRAKWFITWKGGVELQLYEFQLAQSKQRISVIRPEPRQKKNTPTALQPYDDQLALTPQRMSQSVADPPYDFPTNAWEDMDLITDNLDHPLEECSPEVPPVITPNLVVDTPLVQTQNMTMPTVAATFMQERPAGPVQTTNQQLKTLARTITAKVQKKGTTAPLGQAAIQNVASKAKQVNNKENEPGPRPNQKRKPTHPTLALSKTSKRNKGQNVTRQNPKATVTPTPSPVAAQEEIIPVCTYGCSNGGLVGF